MAPLVDLVLFIPRSARLAGTRVRAYIAHGESQAEHRRVYNAGRNPWYSIEEKERGAIIALHSFQYAHKAWENPGSRKYTTSPNCYLTPRGASPDAALALLNSTWAYLAAVCDAGAVGTEGLIRFGGRGQWIRLHTIDPRKATPDQAEELAELWRRIRDRHAVGDREDLVVVGQSFGAFTAPLVAERLHANALALVAGMIPAPGETPGDWWENTGYRAAVAEQAARDGGKTGNEDPYISFFHDVPRELAEEALRRERAHPSEASTASPWPLEAWPKVPTRFVLATEDPFFPPDFFRRLVADRLEITPDEIRSGHCVALSRPRELAGLLESYVTGSS